MGFDKSELVLGGKTFVERAALSLKTIKPEHLFIVGNRPNYSIKLPVLHDSTEKNTRASLIGLYTALRHTKTEWAAILACDLPFATGDLFERLISLRTENYDAVIPIQADGKSQPLCALYRRSCLPAIEEMLRENNWKLQSLLARVKSRMIDFDCFRDLNSAEYLFFNVNTPEDYEKAKQISAGLKMK